MLRGCERWVDEEGRSGVVLIGRKGGVWRESGRGDMSGGKVTDIWSP